MTDDEVDAFAKEVNAWDIAIDEALGSALRVLHDAEGFVEDVEDAGHLSWHYQRLAKTWMKRQLHQADINNALADLAAWDPDAPEPDDEDEQD